jgi:hypothetical protein
VVSFSLRLEPMWRNGRRNGLKITVLAISRLFIADQIERTSLGKSAKFANFVM